MFDVTRFHYYTAITCSINIDEVDGIVSVLRDNGFVRNQDYIIIQDISMGTINKPNNSRESNYFNLFLY